MDWQLIRAYALLILVTPVILTLISRPEREAEHSASQAAPAAKQEEPAAVAIGTPDWAYPLDLPLEASVAPDAIKSVPGSAKSYRDAQIDDPFNPPDWFPDSHPAMPPVVAHGRAPDVFACALCHLPTGQGHPESAALAGLHPSYLIEQMAAFSNGSRTNASAGIMNKIAKATTPAEAKEAANYFASVRFVNASRVVEAETVPKTFGGPGGMRLVTKGTEAGTEPLGERIIVVAEDETLTQLRDPRSGFIYYVPPGSIEKGQKLVKSGAGRTMACVSCHGPALQGTEIAPALAGRSPTYLFRQLNDIKTGTRKGGRSSEMKPVVSKLNLEEMIAISAFLGAQKP